MEPGQDNYALFAALQGTMRVPTHPPTAAWVEPPPPSYDVVAASQPRAAEALPSWLSASTTAATPIGANAAVPRLHSVLDPWRAAHLNGSALQQPLPATDAVSLDAYIATRPPAGVESLLAQYLQTTGTTMPSSVGNHPRTGHTAEASEARESYHAVSFHDLVQHGDVTAAAAVPTNSITTDPCQHMDPTFSDVDRADFRKLRFNEKYASLYPFQQEVFCRALQKSSILYLPTGAGKTIVAAALAAYRHAVNPAKKVVFVVNRVPLVSQQAHVLHRFGLRVAQVCGEKKDASSWEEVAEYFDAVVIIDALLIEMVTRTSTSLFDGCSLVIFDEIHHARKSSNYSKLLQLMGKGDRPHVVGLSASPSARESPDKTRKALEELMGLTRCQLVSVLRETADLEARVSVPVSELIEYAPSNMEKALDEAIRNAIRWIEKIVIPAIRNDNPSAAYPLEGCVGLPYGSPQYVTKCREAQTALLQAFKTGAGTLATLLGVLNQSLILLEEWSACDAANFIVSNPSLNAVFPDLEKSFHSLVEEERLDRKIAWHLQMIIGPLYCTILNLIRRGLASHQVSTKMQLLFHVLQEVVGKEDSEELKNFRGIVFCETKAATVEITTRLQSTPLGKLLRPTYFVGHGRTLVDLRDVSYSIAMSDAKQQKTLQAFREGEIKLLIATSVAEEGLDIPMCNLVVRYEGVFSVQSFIQSRGRARKRNSHFIVISKMTPANPFADVLRDCAMQDTIVKEMCMLDQDAVIAGAETSTGPMRVFEADPLKFLLQVEHTHGATIHMEDRPCKGGVEVIVTVALPDGTNIRGTGVGNQQRASQEARLRVVQQLYNNGYIRGDSLVESFSASTELKRFRYFANPSVALTNAKTASSALTTPLTAGPPAPEITVYDEDHWGTYVKPFVLLDRHLRERGFQAPRAKTTPQQANDGTSVSVEFQMRVNGGGGAPEVKWFYLPGSGATWEIALQTAALSALRALGVNVTLRPHSINSNTTEATATVTQGSS